MSRHGGAVPPLPSHESTGRRVRDMEQLFLAPVEVAEVLDVDVIARLGAPLHLLETDVIVAHYTTCTRTKSRP